jgi:uncharacterized membrane-anchored protein
VSIDVPHPADKEARSPQWLNKVPEVTLWFWVVKVLSTTVGETFADFLNDKLGIGLSGTTLLMAGVLVIALVIQMRARRYVPWKYWFTVVLVSIVGTLITDNLVDNWGVSLYTCTIVFGLAMLVTFTIWYRREGTLSIHHIDSPAREGWYWLAILFTFALGTAAGDLIAEQFNIGYFNSLLLFATAIALVGIAWRFLGLNATAAFWIAYVLTRPLGASLGDLLSQPRGDGGLGLGATTTSYVFLGAIVALVGWMTLEQRQTDRQGEPPRPATT